MARKVRDTSLDSRNGRRSLKAQNKPYWKALDKGLHLGYRKRITGGSWIVRRFTETGKYAESKLGLADDIQDADNIQVMNFSQAQAAARVWYNKAIRIAQGIEEVSTGPYTVENAMKDYLSHYKTEGKGLSVAEAIINAHILPSLGKQEVSKLSSKKITDWHHNLAASPARLRSRKTAEKINTRPFNEKDVDAVRGRRATANRVLTVLKAALNYAWNQGAVPSDSAWRKVKPFRNVETPIIRYLTEAECKRLIKACSDDLCKIVQGALLTGCRYGELTSLITSDFNPNSGTLIIRLSKSGKSRHVVLTDEGKRFFWLATRNKQGSDLIFVHENGKAWGKSHQSRPLLEACKLAKISPAISFHVLRHTHGSLLAMKGVPLPVIAQQLGHADTRMTEKHYAHLSPSYVADTIRQNFPKLGIAENGAIPLNVKN